MFLLTLAGLAAADGPPLGHEDFYPSAERPVGFRGDGNGYFPGATPPLRFREGTPARKDIPNTGKKGNDEPKLREHWVLTDDQAVNLCWKTEMPGWGNDGGIRDTHQILDADFPVFYRYRISNGSLGRCLITHYQVPIVIGAVTIRPGDVILGDVDGVLVVPRAIAYEVPQRAEAIKAQEQKIFSWVDEGASVRQITDRGGYF